jgi:hypothetical protein
MHWNIFHRSRIAGSEKVETPPLTKTIEAFNGKCRKSVLSDDGETYGVI